MNNGGMVYLDQKWYMTRIYRTADNLVVGVVPVTLTQFGCGWLPDEIMWIHFPKSFIHDDNPREYVDKIRNSIRAFDSIQS